MAVAVTQLVERSLPIPEVCGSKPVIGKILYIYWTFVYCQLWIEKMKIKKKRPGMSHLKKLCSTWATLITTLIGWSSSHDLQETSHSVLFQSRLIALLSNNVLWLVKICNTTCNNQWQCFISLLNSQIFLMRLAGSWVMDWSLKRALIK